MKTSLITAISVVGVLATGGVALAANTVGSNTPAPSLTEVTTSTALASATTVDDNNVAESDAIENEIDESNVDDYGISESDADDSEVDENDSDDVSENQADENESDHDDVNETDSND